MHDPAHRLCIRAFRETDLGAVHRLIHNTIDRSYSGIYPPRAVDFFKEFHAETRILDRHRQGEILVVEQEDAIIATGAIDGDEIFGVFVHPDHQHRGLGRSLMAELESRAQQRGVQEAVLSVSLPSRAFYQSLGYRGFEDRSKDLGGGESLDFWVARKPLP